MPEPEAKVTHNKKEVVDGPSSVLSIATLRTQEDKLLLVLRAFFMLAHQNIQKLTPRETRGTALEELQALHYNAPEFDTRLPYLESAAGVEGVRLLGGVRRSRKSADVDRCICNARGAPDANTKGGHAPKGFHEMTEPRVSVAGLWQSVACLCVCIAILLLYYHTPNSGYSERTIQDLHRRITTLRQVRGTNSERAHGVVVGQTDVCLFVVSGGSDEKAEFWSCGRKHCCAHE